MSTLAPPASGRWRTVTCASLPGAEGTPWAGMGVRVRLRLVPDALAPDEWTHFAADCDRYLPDALARLLRRAVGDGVAVPCVLQPAAELLLGGVLEVGRLEVGHGGAVVAWPVEPLHLGFGPTRAMAAPPGARPPVTAAVPPRTIRPDLCGAPVRLPGGALFPAFPPPAALGPRDDLAVLGSPDVPDLAADPFAVDRDLPAAPPPPPGASEPRLMQCRVGPATRTGATDNILRAGRNRVHVFLGPLQVGALVGAAVGDGALAFGDADVVEVGVQLSPYDPVGKRRSGKIFVPRTGMSTTAKLLWDVPEGVTSARAELALIRNGRRIATADLVGEVGGAVRLEAPYVVADPRSPGGADRSVSLVADGDGTPALVVPGHRIELVRDLAALAEQVRKALNRITTLPPGRTADERLASGLDVLIAVAQAGSDLFIELDSRLGRLKGATSLQVITSQAPSALPVELLYTLPAPRADATLCPTWLAGGDCGPQCVRDRPASVVCPHGFWGVARVVERHYVDKTVGEAVVDVSPPDVDGPRLPLGDVVLAAASKVQRDYLVQAGLGDVTRLTTWDAWGAALAASDGLVVLMPHTEPSPARLEISDQFLARSTLQGYLENARDAHRKPTVLLFGCDTGGRADDPVGYAGRFLATGATVVFASLSLVLADVAPLLASRLVAALRDPAHAGRSVAGVLTDVRAGLLRDGVLAALTLTSYGSTDWEV